MTTTATNVPAIEAVMTYAIDTGEKHVNETMGPGNMNRARQGPVDVAAISEAADVYLFDAKKNATRVNPGRKTRTRIHRVRSDIQNRLGVRMAYVDVDTREVHIVPEIDEKTPQHLQPGGVAIEYDDGLGET
jgi:hypothetical protein